MIIISHTEARAPNYSVNNILPKVRFIHMSSYSFIMEIVTFPYHVRTPDYEE